MPDNADNSTSASSGPLTSSSSTLPAPANSDFQTSVNPSEQLQPSATPKPPDPPFPIKVDKPQPSKPAVESSPPPPPDTPSVGEPANPDQVIEPFFKRILPFIIGLVAVVLLILLASKVILPIFQKSKQPEIISLTYWGLWEPESIITQIISDYQQENPNITIQYLRQSPQDYRERLQSALAQGKGPDIFRWHNTWLPMLKNDLAPVPDTIYSDSDFNTIFYPIVKKDVFAANSYYGVPLGFDTLALYVNQDVFVNNPEYKVPTTWDNLRQTAFKLTQRDARGKIIRAGVALGTTENVDHFSDILGLMILQNGGDPSQPESEAVISALKFYTLFSSQDHSWNNTLPNSTHSFATEKAVMMIAPSWRALEVRQLNPNLNFKLYPAPQLPGTNVAWATYWIEGVSQKSPSKQAAWDFIKYLSSQETLSKMYNLASQTRLFGEPYPRQDMASLLQTDPFTGAIISQAISAHSWPLVSRTFDNGLNDRLIKYYQDAVNSILNQEQEKIIFATLSQGVSQVLSQYGLAN